MSKKQKDLNSRSNQVFFFLILTGIILASFLLFVPKVSSSLFPFKRQMIWNNFLSETTSQRKIDPQKYWEFREFYSPGYFTFSREGFKENQINQTLNDINIPIEEKSIERNFLIFNSPRIISIDSLTKLNDLNKIIDFNKLHNKKILFRNSDSIIYLENEKQAKIIFLLNSEDMKKANGFFDVNSANDQRIIENKYWINITSIKLN